LRISRLLAQSTDRDNDRKHFFRAQILFWALAATDGHGKTSACFWRLALPSA
jgi:serine/threonine-protein kinase HipA